MQLKLNKTLKSICLSRSSILMHSINYKHSLATSMLSCVPWLRSEGLYVLELVAHSLYIVELLWKLILFQYFIFVVSVISHQISNTYKVRDSGEGLLLLLGSSFQPPNLSLDSKKWAKLHSFHTLAAAVKFLLVKFCFQWCGCHATDVQSVCTCVTLKLNKSFYRWFRRRNRNHFAFSTWSPPV